MSGVPTTRDSREADLGAIQQIYAFHVLHGLASFEEVPPSVEELGRRRQDVLRSNLPHLVAEFGGTIVGYSYASPYRQQPAFRHTIENSVYVRNGYHGHGIGRALLAALIARCELGPWRQMVAVIGDTENHASIGLHAAFGFRPAGTVRSVGFKFGRWVDSVLMQRALGDQDA
ncbi:N-acetyltransferase family protein [Thalassobaculum sp.]|uniref:GNAT family N-acetyltransferase n=1 Tax=Thalassobaculum sp. TaxID=2022740 RepID=UPI0032EB6DF9